MDKTDKLLEDSEDVAAHHGLYSKNPAWAPRGTSNNPILMPLSYMGGKQHTGDAESKGEPCFLEVCSGRAHWNPWVCRGHQWQMDSAHAGRYARVCVPSGLLWGAMELLRAILLPQESLRGLFLLLPFSTLREHCEMSLKPLSLH